MHTEVAAEGRENDWSLKRLRQQAMAQVEREAIERALCQSQGNKSRATRLLQIDYKTLDVHFVNPVPVYFGCDNG